LVVGENFDEVRALKIITNDNAAWQFPETLHPFAITGQETTPAEHDARPAGSGSFGFCVVRDW
jgi:hypothetical protein